MGCICNQEVESESEMKASYKTYRPVPKALLSNASRAFANTVPSWGPGVGTPEPMWVSLSSYPS